MKAKRLAAVLMSGALAAGTLAGCGGGGNSSGGEGGDSGSGKIELEFFTQKGKRPILLKKSSRSSTRARMKSK
nr:hypothetical protein [uncultured Schaedlerella sp.]